MPDYFLAIKTIKIKFKFEVKYVDKYLLAKILLTFLNMHRQKKKIK